jgi:serine protease Do
VALASVDSRQPGGSGVGRGPAADAARPRALPSHLVDAAGGATVRLLATRTGGAAVTEIGFGVLVDGRGWVVTPERLLGDARVLEVRLADGRLLPVARVWRDPLAGVAVLKIEGAGFPALVMGDSSRLRVGDAATLVGWAAAVYPPTIEARIRATGAATGGSVAIDVAVAGDRIGSPLIDQSGRIVAIATTDEASPSGVAIPIDRAKPMLRQAMATGAPRGPAGSGPRAVGGR